MKHLFAFAFIFFSINTFALEIKGIALGSSPEEFQKLYPYHNSGWSTPGYGGYCNDDKENRHCDYTGYHEDQFTIAGVSARPDLFYKDEKLEFISIEFNYPELNFQKVLTAVTTKFGTPTEKIVVPLQNGYGATFTYEIITWTLPDGVITLTKKSSSVLLEVESIERNKRVTEQKEKERKHNSGDL